MEIPRFRPQPGRSIPDDADPLLLLVAWWRAVGEPVARLASPRGVSRRRLKVAVPDQRWRREIGEHLEEILTRLRQSDGLQGLDGIDLVVEHEPLRAVSPAVAGASRDPAGEPPREAPLLPRSIADCRLAQRWEAVVARILARREAGLGF
jgi:hypothetical protein